MKMMNLFNTTESMFYVVYIFFIISTIMAMIKQRNSLKVIKEAVETIKTEMSIEKEGE